VNPGFCEKMEATRVPPGRPSHTTGGTRTTGPGLGHCKNSN